MQSQAFRGTWKKWRSRVWGGGAEVEAAQAMISRRRLYLPTILKLLHLASSPMQIAPLLSAALLTLLSWIHLPSAAASCLDDAPYPAWAHSHWIWQSADDLTQQGAIRSFLTSFPRFAFVSFVTDVWAGTIDLLGNYTQRGIPVGAVNLDSLWQVGEVTCDV
jgi:hypothetical protein